MPLSTQEQINLLAARIGDLEFKLLQLQNPGYRVNGHNGSKTKVFTVNVENVDFEHINIGGIRYIREKHLNGGT